MCGIFGFSLKKHVPMVKVFNVLKKLEVHQYPTEHRPVGGYGAGIAILKEDGNVLLEKVGKDRGVSPVRCLSETVTLNKASFLIGHVRMPSPQFMETARFNETAQPYVAKCYQGLTVISAHNGNLTNYKEIREKLGRTHVFESERVELIDSEVIPHLFEELLKEKTDFSQALNALFTILKGPNTLSLLQIENEHTLLHFVHKGKTRGLHVWTNGQNEAVFCSRSEPLMEEFSDIISQGKFKKTLEIQYGAEASLKLSLPLSFK